MVRRCILHAGLPKTGTTALQAALSRLNHADFRYASLRNSNHSVPLILLYTGDPRRCVGYPRIEGMNRWAAKGLEWLLRRDWKKALRNESETLILSAESVFTNLRPEELRRLRDDLQTSFDEVAVIVYVRPYHDLVSSLWQQRLRRGVADLKLTPQPYRKILEPALQLFGRESINFRRFAREDMVDGDLFADFAAQVGLPKGHLQESGTRFASLSLEAAAVMFAHNRARKPLMGHAESKAVKERARLTAVLERYGDGKIGFSPDRLNRAVERSRDALDWLEEQTGFDVVGEAKSVERPIAGETDLLDLAHEHGPKVAAILKAQGHVALSWPLGDAVGKDETP